MTEFDRKSYDEINRLRDLLNKDRLGLASALSEISKLVHDYWWVTQGRGFYEWDDSRYRDEMKTMITIIKEKCACTLRNSGRLVNEGYFKIQPDLIDKDR